MLFSVAVCARLAWVHLSPAVLGASITRPTRSTWGPGSPPSHWLAAAPAASYWPQLHVDPGPL